MAQLSPMMQQYFDIKEKNKDAILFFRLGDFYEMFFDDAKTASRELELTLTGKDCGQKERAPMCGVPYHSCEAYITRLVEKGYKVAICEQTEDPAKAKGLVKRDIIRVITPGTVIESSMLDESKNNFICCAYLSGGKTGLCFCDVSTGKLCAVELADMTDINSLKNQLTTYNPSELIIGGEVQNVSELSSFIKNRLKCQVQMLTDDFFEPEKCKKAVDSAFDKYETEKLENHQTLICSLGALLEYLSGTQMTGLERINRIEMLSENQFMGLDYNTRRNLELTSTMRSNEKRGSLLWVLDKTKTAMGKRLIRTWIEQPLVNISAILRRQNAVGELFGQTMLRLDISEALCGIFDIERLMTRIVYGNANARDLRSLASAVSKLPKLKELLKDTKTALMQEIYENFDTLSDIYELIDSAIVDEPPFSVREGAMIKRGYNKELDAVSSDMTDSTSLLAGIEAAEREKTGIPKLKIGYNRVFGYYIEVTNSYRNLIPPEYIRKQTLANCERYITEDLKQIENRILGAKDKAVAMEYAIFEDVRKKTADRLERFQKTAKAVAQLDVLCSLANVSSDNKYTAPEVNLSDDLILKDSRHPVVEQLNLGETPFVPNDVSLNCTDSRVAIITGPNMAGKSTYMRQTALIVLMAQIGCFVPASYAKIGVVDKIFTRVGASDDLSTGQSTFMVEMSEVANIVTNATSKSLLILDEIGRGTSTFDGMSIARAVLEYVADRKKLGARTLFATHYHELTVLENLLDGVKNYNIAVKKRGDDITFLRRIVRGGADDSYGIEVAKFAGVPQWIINRAKEILKELESGKASNSEIKKPKKVQEESVFAPSLLASADSALKEELEKIDVDTLTPIEALNTLYKLKSLI